MKFSKLAEYFEKLEKTSKRLELVDILSKLFREAKSGEIGEICYLIQGRVAPFYEPVEIGIAEMTIAQAVGRAYDKSKDEVISLYREKGNFGLAAAQLSQNAKRLKTKALSVSEVFEELRKIAEFVGIGTVEKKVGTLASLLKNLDPISVKHVVNIPLGTLRLGVGGPTVLDALSLAKKGDKSLRPVLEAAYNKVSDLGYVARVFWEKGETGVRNLKLVVGKPIRSALAERLPSAAEVIKRVGGEFATEPKFDGFRVQVHLDRSGKLLRTVGGKAGQQFLSAPNLRDVSSVSSQKDSALMLEKPQKLAHLSEVRLFSRNLENTTAAFPDLVSSVLEEVNAKSAIIDGEAIAYNPKTEEFLPFQETTKRRRKYKVDEMAQKLPLILFAFDLLYLNGEDITSLPYKVRREKLSGIIKEKEGKIRLAEERILHKEEDILKFFNEAVSEGLEGIMIKKLDSPYVAGGRGFHWIKFKRSSSGELTDTVDCVLLGIYAGRGKRTEFGVGGLLVGIYDQKKDEFQTISRVGTGLTDEEFRRVKTISDKLKVTKKPSRVNSKVEPSMWVEPKVVLEIFADEITKSPIHTAGEENGVGYALRFPRLVKFRDDRKAEDATTVDEIKKMYVNQYKHKKS